jgi:hypothetical protein
MSSERTSWLTADLDARYVYHPPSLLSEMLPTRADMVVQVARVGCRPRYVASLCLSLLVVLLARDGGKVVDFVGVKWMKCLARRRGPRVLVWKVSSACSALTCDGERSG